jgi:glycosyltransferase involved in cell wall biosynthesis
MKATTDQNSQPTSTNSRGDTFTLSEHVSSDLHVMHVVDNLALGGTQNLVLRAVAALVARGIHCSLVVLGSEEKTSRLHWLPVKVHYLDLDRDYRNPFVLHRGAARLRSMLDELKPSIVHSYLWFSDVICALAVARRGGIHVSQIVDRRCWLESPHLRHRLRKWFTRVLLHQSGATFLAVSQAAADFAIRHLSLRSEDVRVAPNGITSERFADIPESAFLAGHRDELRIGIAARLEPEKGHEILFEALALLIARGLPIRLLITGDGPNISGLRRRAAELGITDRIELVGVIGDVAEFYGDIDFFVVPSIHSEGLPTTILEAMAARRVVITTDVGGATEAIRDGIDGLVVPSYNPTALAEAIAVLAGDRELCRRLAASAFERVCRQFSVDQMIGIMATEYQRRLLPMRSNG